MCMWPNGKVSSLLGHPGSNPGVHTSNGDLAQSGEH